MCGLYRMLKMTATEDENRLGAGEYVLKIYVDIIGTSKAVISLQQIQLLFQSYGLLCSFKKEAESDQLKIKDSPKIFL